MNKLGTHHSLSYIQPKWYWKPLNWTTQCQRISLTEQINSGVIYFDIRVRFYKGQVISGHGLINYPTNVLTQLALLASVAKKDNPIYIRIMYESKAFHKNPSVKEMQDFMKRLIEEYPQLTFTDVHIKEPYTHCMTVSSVSKKDCYQFYKDYGAKTFVEKLKGFKLPFPLYFAKKKNHKYREAMNDSCIHIFDFIDVC